MTYRRPFETRHFTAYAGDSLVERLSLAVLLTDGYTGMPPGGAFRVFLRERGDAHRRGQEPVRNPSGYFCFLDVPDGSYTIVVEPGPDERRYHLRPGVGGGDPTDLERAVDLPRPDPEEPVVELTLIPDPGYLFPPNATLVRGTVVRGGNAHPVRGAAVASAYQRAAPTVADPGATAAAAVETRTDAAGEWVLFFRAPSPPEQEVDITATAQTERTVQETMLEGRTVSGVDIVLP